MRTTEPTKIVVGPNDAIPDVLTRLHTATGGPATIAIPVSSSLFLTASEFRALKATTDQSRITLTVETDDRLRKQLAMMFNIPVIELLPGALDGLEQRDDTPPLDEPQKPESVLPDLPKLNLPPAQEVAPLWEPRSTDDTDDDSADTDEKPKRRSFPIPLKAVAIAIGAVVALALLAVAAAYFLRTATVRITVKRQPVTAEVTYAVVNPGGPAPEGALFTVSSAPVTLEVPYRETIPVTGELREPDQIAGGRVALRNPSDAPVEIPADSTFVDRNGVEYAFATAVTVPAADERTGAGRADADIRAVAGGEAANRDIGMLSGQLENGVYYSNRDAAVGGGTDRVTKIVAQEDIDRLVANANEQLPQRLVSAPLPDGRVVLPGTLQPGKLDYTTDHKAGEQVDSVTIDATMVVSAMAFNPADAVSQATQQLQSGLAANTPAGYELEPTTLTTADPVLVNDQGNAGLYVLTASANARAVVDDAQRDEISNAVTGLEPAEAEAVVRQYPFVDQASIDTSPGILFTSLPGSADKIEIETQ